VYLSCFVGCLVSGCFKKFDTILQLSNSANSCLDHIKFSQCVYKQYKFLSFKFQVFTGLNKEIPDTCIKRAFCVPVMDHENSSQLKQWSLSSSGTELNLVVLFPLLGFS